MSTLLHEIKSLPVYPFLPDISGRLEISSLLLVQAEPGAGKTTLIPWFLSGSITGKILMMEPRRVAARAAAERIASLMGEPLGESVGVRTRVESISGRRVEVITEAVLVRMLQSDPSLEGVSLLIFDEFHERSVAADLGLSLAMKARELFRPDLSIIVMSATIAESLLAPLGDFYAVKIPGRSYPVTPRYLPSVKGERLEDGMARLIREALRVPFADGGDILVFLPGFREIMRVRECLGSLVDAEILIMHGSLPPQEQRRVLSKGVDDPRRIILSTNVAETSLTIPGVKTVVDSGLVRRVSFSPRTGMDHRSTGAISQASADQRMGRAGRLAPGVCYRYWDARDYRDSYDLPEIMTSDLAPLYLDCAMWGADEADPLQWVTDPPKGIWDRAASLLHELALIDGKGIITEKGKRASALALHPRLAAMVLDAQNESELCTASLIAALLEEESLPAGRDNADLRDHLMHSIGRSDMRRTADEARRICRAAGGGYDERAIDASSAGLLLLRGFPDRAAKRIRAEADGSSRWQLSAGRGAVLRRGVFTSDEYLVACDIEGGDVNARITLAAPLDADLVNDGKAGVLREEVSVEWNGWRARGMKRTLLGNLAVKEILLPSLPRESVEAELAARIQKNYSVVPFGDGARTLFNRIAFAARSSALFADCSLSDFFNSSANSIVPFADYSGGDLLSEAIIDAAVRNYIGWENLRLLDANVPEYITLPSGSRKSIDYSQEIPVLEARLQEFFGSLDTPSVCGVPLMLHLLSPANRPVQVTRDLAGFWDRAYPEVKKELKGRYPRHYWPDDPREAEPTARAKPRGK